MGELRRVLCGTPVHPSLFVGRLRKVSLSRSETKSCPALITLRCHPPERYSGAPQNTLRSRPTESGGNTGVPQSALRSSPIFTPLLRMPRGELHGTEESKAGPS